MNMRHMRKQHFLEEMSSKDVIFRNPQRDLLGRLSSLSTLGIKINCNLHEWETGRRPCQFGLELLEVLPTRPVKSTQSGTSQVL